MRELGKQKREVENEESVRGMNSSRENSAS